MRRFWEVVIGEGCLVVQEGLIMLKVMRFVNLRVPAELWWLWEKYRVHAEIWLAYKFLFLPLVKYLP